MSDVSDLPNQAGKDPSVSWSRRWISAAQNGNLNEIKELIANGEGRLADDNRALQWAAQYGHPKSVELLLTVCDAKLYNSQALKWAAKFGEAGCVRLLLPHSDAKANQSMALRLAIMNGHAESVALLLSHSDLAQASEGEQWQSMEQLARAYGHQEVGDMIRAFTEARDIASSLPGLATRAAAPAKPAL